MTNPLAALRDAQHHADNVWAHRLESAVAETAPMPKPKPPPHSLQNADELEAHFYEALQTGQIEALMACWADEDDVVCVHPGGPRMVGLAAIRAGFETLFANGTLRVQAQQLRRVDSAGASVHSVIERIEVLTPDGPQNAYVIATNVYQKTVQGWRMVVHHASPGTAQEMQELSERPALLH